jgi:LmbE family N-acetylglucosaminyl deacetylase
LGKLSILAIGSHPDDIELGCGGTLIKAAAAGHDIYAYVLTRGSKSGNPTERTKELFESAKFMRAKTLWVDNFEDAELSIESKLINHIEYFISKADPDIILTHAPNDYHHDHRAVAESTLEAARNSQNVLAYEIPVTKHFTPQLYYDISSVIQDKIRLVSLFVSQKGKSFTLERAVKGLAEYRALQSRLNANVTHAEAFQVLKMVTNVDFGLMKFARAELPQAVHASIFSSLKDVIDYTPFPSIPTRSAGRSDGMPAATLQVGSQEMVIRTKPEEKISTASGPESAQDSPRVHDSGDARHTRMVK